jgi:predicted nucleic acid-binding protein
MTLPIFLDTNVPIYAAGRPHALKEPCAQILMLVAERPHAFLTDAEVLQELLHRYLALHLWPQGREVFHRFATLMRERVEPVYAADVEQACALADQYPELAARDLLHAAVMNRLGVRNIVSADAGFDRLSHLERLDPKDVPAWRDEMPG